MGTEVIESHPVELMMKGFIRDPSLSVGGESGLGFKLDAGTGGEGAVLQGCGTPTVRGRVRADIEQTYPDFTKPYRRGWC